MCIQKIIYFVFTLVEGNLDPRALEGGWSEDAHSNAAFKLSLWCFAGFAIEASSADTVVVPTVV